MSRRNWKKGKVGSHREATSVSRCCVHMLASQPSLRPHRQTPHPCHSPIFWIQREKKALGYPSIQTHQGTANTNSLTFCHRDYILLPFCFLSWMQIFPFYALLVILLGIWARSGVSAYTKRHTQRFQRLPSKNWTFQLKNHIWIEALLNIFSSLFTSIFWIKWTLVIMPAIFNIHISRKCCEKTAGKGNITQTPIICS